MATFPGINRVYVTKFDTDGHLVWSGVLPGTGGDAWAVSMALDSSRNVYVVGNLTVTKISADGLSVLWSYAIDGKLPDDMCTHIAVAPDGSVYAFFFSSRRRHTRCLSDWSSDVCSSD